MILSLSTFISGITAGCLTENGGETSTKERESLPENLICDDNRPNIPPGEGGGGYCGTNPERAQTVIKYNITQDVDPLGIESWGGDDYAAYVWNSVQVDITEGNIRAALLFRHTRLRVGSEYIRPSGITVPIAPNNNVGTDGSLSSFDNIRLGEGGFGSVSNIYFRFQESTEIDGWDVDDLFSQQDDVSIY